MKEEMRRILKSTHDHKGSVTFYITRHDEGAGPVYRLEDLHGIPWSWGNEAKAKAVASALLKEDAEPVNDIETPRAQ